ncbi:MAG: hypothetical protein AAFZ15_24970 [Bacteroidota bacterium]
MKELIAKDELVKAMNTFMERAAAYSREHYNMVVLLSRELYNFKKDEIKGIYDREQSQRTKNHLAIRMIDLIDLIEQ